MTKYRQAMLPFRARWLRRERRFKTAMIVFTLLGCAGAAATPVGRYLINRGYRQGRSAIAYRVFGLETPRSQTDELWRLKRNRDVDRARSEFGRKFGTSDPPLKRLLTASGMDPENAIIRWGNFDQTFVLSSQVLAVDDHGRSYRFLPNVRSIWLWSIDPPREIPGLFLFQVPDTQIVHDSLAGTGAIPIVESVQNTNSWGFRGPEPSVKAKLRILVLGDSYMQGMLIGDADAPPFQLEKELERKSGVAGSVSVLNTGVLGYSTEQYYHTLMDTHDRFRPHAIVVSVCANDFGSAEAALEHGEGDWEEGKYWLGLIEQFCRAHENLPSLIVPAPSERQLAGPRKQGNFPGKISNLLTRGGFYFLDPTDVFVDEHLRLSIERKRAGLPLGHSPLYNGQYNDGHFSPQGARLWASAVAERLTLLLDWSKPSSKSLNTR